GGKHGALMVAQIESPSWLLAKSRAGWAIYTEAQRQWFKEDELVNRFTRNYQRAVKGLNKAEKLKIARFRLRVDEEGKRVETPEPLSEKLQKVNDDLTKFVYEPMW